MSRLLASVRRAAWPVILLCSWAIFGGTPARGHDIYSSWLETKVLPDRLEVTLTLARSSAQEVLPQPRRRSPLTSETFREHVAALRSAAPGLVQISAGTKPLTLRVVDVKLSGDNDATFTLSAPRPKFGPLRFFLRYLEHLVSGHVATVVVTDGHSTDLGWSPVTVEQPFFAVPFPPVPPKK